MKLKDNFVHLTQDERLYGLSVPIIGLTGGIASGKSTVGQILVKKGFPLISADTLVKEVYELPETREFLKDHFPRVVEKETVNFPLLREIFFKDRDVKTTVENFIYQRLPKAFKSTLGKLKNPEVVVYDVPLLFEKNMQSLFDLTVLVYVPRKMQLERLVARDGIKEDLANSILDQQMDIEEKKKHSDFIINNFGDEVGLLKEVESFLQKAFY